MKLAVKILLIVFITFLSTPTIVSLIEKSTDTSCFYCMSEEEQMNKEIKAEFNFEPFSIVLPNHFKTSNQIILSENLSRHDNIASTIFIPPPEQV